MTDDRTISLALNSDELQLLKAAVQLLMSTLGHEEADELEPVRDLLGRQDRLGPAA